MKHLLLFPLFVLCLTPRGDCGFDLDGNVSQCEYLSAIGRKQVLGSETNLGVSFSVGQPRLAAKCRIDVLFDDQAKLEPREVVISYSGREFSLVAGNQLIRWGTTPWLPVNDVINPWDLDTRRSRLEDIRTPIPAVKLGWYPSFWTFELVWIPSFVPTRLPDEKFAPIRKLIDLTVGRKPLVVEDVPNQDVRDTELGATLSASWGIIDCSLYSFRGWQDFPSVDFSELLDDNRIKIVYPPLKLLGTKCHFDLGHVIGISELSYQIIEGDRCLKSAFGGMIRPFSETMFELIYYREDDMSGGENPTSSVFCEGTHSWRELTLEFVGRYVVTDKDFFAASRVTYAVNDRFSVIWGALIFGGNSEGEFGEMWRRSYMFAKTQYDF